MLHIEISTEEYISNPKIQNIGIPIVVEYKKKRPKWDLISYISKPNEHIHDLIRFKSEAWIYEYELRLLNDKKYGFIEMPETWIKSIIVGLAAEEELKNELIKIGKRINRPVFFAEMDRYEFKVKIPGLTFNSISGIENYNKFRSSYKKLMSV